MDWNGERTYGHLYREDEQQESERSVSRGESGGKSGCAGCNRVDFRDSRRYAGRITDALAIRTRSGVTGDDE